MTDGTTRRKELMKMLQHETKPLSGTELAKHFGVSRQVIVQDIALLRATDRNILSTNKGYVLFHPEQEEDAAEGFLRPITGKNGCRKNCI
ncbi:MAG: HTH domain-containing protein [Eubacterium ramulus]